jgi:hypothetical protein
MGTKVYGNKSIWEQKCMGTKVYKSINRNQYMGATGKVAGWFTIPT